MKREHIQVSRGKIFLFSLLLSVIFAHPRTIVPIVAQVQAQQVQQNDVQSFNRTVTLWAYPTNIGIWARIFLKVERKSIRERRVAGRFEGLSDLEWKLFCWLATSTFGEKRAWDATRTISASIEHTTTRTDYWLQMVWCTMRWTVGIKKFCPSLA